MNEYYPILTPVLTVFLVIGAGFAVRWTGVLNPVADQSLFRVVVNLFYPCLILDAMVGNAALRQPGLSLLAPLICLVTILAGVGVGWLGAPLAGLAAGAERRTFAATAGLYNYSFFAIPVLLALFDLKTVGVCFAYNMGAELSLWTIIAWLLRGGSPARDWRKILNAPLAAILLGLLLNGFPVRDATPVFIWTTVAMLGKCTIPLGLMLVGVSFYDFLLDGPGELLKHKRVSLVALLCRSLLLPLAMITLARYAPVPLVLKRVLVVQAAMPAAVFPVAMVRHYGGHLPTALRVVLVTTAFGLLTVPLWIHLGLRWIE